MRVRYFAWLRARIGRAEEEIPLPPEVGDVAALLDWLVGRGGSYEAALANRGAIRVAVNKEYVGFSHPLAEGDEVALFPPVTGG